MQVIVRGAMPDCSVCVPLFSSPVHVVFLVCAVSDLFLTFSLPIPLRLYTLPYWPNPPFFSGALSTRAPECQKLKMVD